MCWCSTCSLVRISACQMQSVPQCPAAGRACSDSCTMERDGDKADCVCLSVQTDLEPDGRRCFDEAPAELPGWPSCSAPCRGTKPAAPALLPGDRTLRTKQTWTTNTLFIARNDQKRLHRHHEEEQLWSDALCLCLKADVEDILYSVGQLVTDRFIEQLQVNK